MAFAERLLTDKVSSRPASAERPVKIHKRKMRNYSWKGSVHNFNGSAAWLSEAKIERLAKRRDCLLSYSQAEPEGELTQPRKHILAEPCIRRVIHVKSQLSFSPNVATTQAFRIYLASKYSTFDWSSRPFFQQGPKMRIKCGPSHAK